MEIVLRILDIVFIRESDRNKKNLILGMAQQTLLVHLTALPDLRPLFEAGLEPIEHPAKWNAETRSGGGWRSCVVQVGSTLVVYYLGTAAVPTEQGDYEFAEFAMNLIEKYRPEHIRCGPMTRLMREKVPASLLFDKMRSSGVQSILGDGVSIDPRTGDGEMQWQMHTIFATNERRMIMTRLLLGKAAAAMRNQNPFADRGVPLGYCVSGDTLEPDIEMIQVIREALQLMADPMRSARELTELLGRHGVSTPLLRKRRGEDLTVADLIEPKDFRESFLKWLSLYETGTYVQPHGIRILGITQIGDLPVLKNDRYPDGYIELSYTWGLPPGGWAPSEVFVAIRAGEAKRRMGRTTNSRTARRPFTQLPMWRANGFEWRLATNDASSYILERRTVEAPESSDRDDEDGIEVKGPWRVVGRILNAELGRAVHHAAGRAFRAVSGTPIELATSSKLPIALASRRREQTERTLVEVASLRGQADRARRRSNRVEDDETAALLLADAQKYLADADRLVSSLSVVDDARPAPESLELNVGTLLAVLQTIAQARGSIARNAADVVAQTFIDFSIVQENDREEADLSFSMEIPVNEDEVAVIGPIRGTVVTYGQRRTSAYRSPNERLLVDILRRLAAGESQEDVIHDLGDLSEFRLRLLVTAAGETVGIPRRVSMILVTSPIPELHCLLARLVRLGGAEAIHGLSRAELEAWAVENLLVPDGATPAWAALVLDCYFGSDVVTSQWSARNVLQFKAIRILEEEGGQATLSELRKDHADFDDQNFRGIVLGHRSSWQPVLRTEKFLTTRPTVRRGSFFKDTMVSLWPCPHCGGRATVPLQALEIPAHLLCPSCHRSQDDDSPLYPDSYFNLPTQIDRGSTLGASNQVSPNRAELLALKGEDARPSGLNRHTVADVDPQARQEICDAYAKTAMPIIGPDGICEAFTVKLQLLYRILDAAGVERRHGRVNRRPTSDESDNAVSGESPRRSATQ